jgi:acetyl-CoA C-acetyltransferase
VQGRPVAIVGTGQTKYQHYYPDRTQPELARSAVLAALDDSHLRLEDVDGVSYSMAPDALIGVMHAEAWVADAVAAAGRPMIRINTGGSSGISAIQVGYEHVASGLCDVVVVAGADRVGESGDAQTVLNRIWDPVYERPLPLNTVTMLAMQAIRFFTKYGATELDMARVSVKNHGNGYLNPYAHIQQTVRVDEVLSSRMISYPIKLLDSCPQSSGAAALILASEDVAWRVQERPAWLLGIGFGAETYWMGDRMGDAAISDHAESPQQTSAVSQALKMAAIEPKSLDVAELYAPFSAVELHAIQDALLCERGSVMKLLEDGYFNLDGEIPVNPSGGVMCANPIAATAMIRVIEVALQVTGRAGRHQVEEAHIGIATGIGGDHQFFGAVVVGDEPQKGPDS